MPILIFMALVVSGVAIVFVKMADEVSVEAASLVTGTGVFAFDASVDCSPNSIAKKSFHQLLSDTSISCATNKSSSSFLGTLGCRSSSLSTGALSPTM